MAAFIDLDRTLLGRASAPVLNEALVGAGVIGANRSFPGDGALYAFYDRFGETIPSMALARVAARVAKGWVRSVVQEAAEEAVGPLLERVQPFAPGILADLRAAGHELVLATTTPEDLVRPLADALGLDDVIATRYETRDGRYTGRLEGGFVWGIGKLVAVRRWARQHKVPLSESVACSDSVFDTPLLSSVGDPRAVNPDVRLLALAALRRWPIEYWDRPAGVPSLAGLEPYHLLAPFIRPELFPYARFSISGIDHVPAHGPVILAANHRSYFDVAALALVAARLGRPVRFLAKRELFEVPLAGAVARAIGGIPVDRGHDGGKALTTAEAALRAGEVVIVLPQGTIPRGEAFFDPALQGRTGTARLTASTGAPVVPVGIWGTESVWPRSSRTPDITALGHPPQVKVRVGRAVTLTCRDAVADTATIMAAVSALLPPAARRPKNPTPRELARTFPPGWSTVEDTAPDRLSAGSDAE